jgi:hypothetical protein
VEITPSAGSGPKIAKKKTTFKIGGGQFPEVNVGRSKGAQFLEGKGISLHWDKETSTWHGKFTLKNDQLWFEDLHSTNMTTVLSTGKPELEIGKHRSTQSAQVQVGDVLKIGSCRLKILTIERAEF